MVQSMTGFASGTGALAPYSWHWEIRSVNAKGLDIRLRVPDWIDGLEAALKARLAKSVSRGNITLSLRIQREEASGALTVNDAVLGAVLTALKHTQDQARDHGIDLAPSSGMEVLNMRGVLEQSVTDNDSKAVSAALLADVDSVLDQFLDMRAGEGKALHDVLTRALGDIEDLVAAAATAVEARKDESEAAFRAALARITQNSEAVEDQRIAQELAVLAVKADVTEEMDRLHAHVGAAHKLLQERKPVGRKFDFLMQEFNREANTLCSKSQNKQLTQVGLDLKTVIDQMREQVQNVE